MVGDVDFECIMLIKVQLSDGVLVLELFVFVMLVVYVFRVLWLEGQVRVIVGQGQYVIGEYVCFDGVVIIFGVFSE